MSKSVYLSLSFARPQPTIEMETHALSFGMGQNSLVFQCLKSIVHACYSSLGPLLDRVITPVLFYNHGIFQFTSTDQLDLDPY